MNSRNSTIDILRFVAVVLVLGRHSDHLNISDYGPVVSTVSQAWMTGGWVGVDLFFVLSGFLVSGLLFREGQNLNISRFLIRRGFKIYPSFYVLIFATLVYDLIFSTGVRPDTYLSEIVFAQSYFPHVWPHTWSLAVEEHFYILLPLALLVIKRTSRGGQYSQLPIAVAAVCVASLTGRIALAASADIAWSFQNGYYFATHLRIDALAFGVLLSYLVNYDPKKLDVIARHRREFLTLSLALIAPAFLMDVSQSFFISTFEYTFLYIGFGISLIAALGSDRIASMSAGRIGRVAAYLGRHSYSVYLWHYPIKLITHQIFFRILGVDSGSLVAGSIVEFGVYLTASFAIGIAMAKLIEFPALRLRESIFSRTRSSAAVQAPA